MGRFLGEIAGYVQCKPQLYDNKMLQNFKLNKIHIHIVQSTLVKLIGRGMDLCVKFYLEHKKKLILKWKHSFI